MLAECRVERRSGKDRRRCVAMACSARISIPRGVHALRAETPVWPRDPWIPQPNGPEQPPISGRFSGCSCRTWATNGWCRSTVHTAAANGIMGGGTACGFVRMRGPEIFTRWLSQRARNPDEHGNRWQYNSRSDKHSKVACWAVLFDLLGCCSLFRRHVDAGIVGFGINHKMQSFGTGGTKELDLVISTAGTHAVQERNPQLFTSLVEHYEITLTEEERQELDSLPILRRVSVGTVHVALEAKATMTAHIKALPRLHDELNSSHLTIHGSSDFAIAAGFAMVNLAATFVSPDRNRHNLSQQDAIVSTHNQPHDATRTIARIREIPRRANVREVGFDALGIVVVNLSNDGSPATLAQSSPAPLPTDIFHYDQMIRRIQSLYESRFADLLSE